MSIVIGQKLSFTSVGFVSNFSGYPFLTSIFMCLYEAWLFEWYLTLFTKTKKAFSEKQPKTFLNNIKTFLFAIP